MIYSSIYYTHWLCLHNVDFLLHFVFRLANNHCARDPDSLHTFSTQHNTIFTVLNSFIYLIFPLSLPEPLLIDMKNNCKMKMSKGIRIYHETIASGGLQSASRISFSFAASYGRCVDWWDDSSLFSALISGDHHLDSSTILSLIFCLNRGNLCGESKLSLKEWKCAIHKKRLQIFQFSHISKCASVLNMFV